MIHFYSSNRPRLPRVFRLIGYAGIAFGILAIVLQLSSASTTSSDKNNAIVTIVFASLLLIGFSYLVEAAIIYIEEYQSKKEGNDAMGNVGKLGIIAFLLSLSLSSSAQAYIPKENETFFFYPVSSEVRDSIKGFDCFYSTELAYKNDKFKIKPKFRFKVNANELTPFAEIEGRQFTMLSSIVENKDDKNWKRKPAFCS